MSTKFCTLDGHITERLMAYYEARAQGGAGMVTVEACCIHEAGPPTGRWLRLLEDRAVPSFAELAHRIKQHGACACIQLAHTGRAANAEANRRPVQIVSYIPGVTPYNDSRVLTTDDMAELAECWGKAALRVKQAGFDAVELHGAHGYLLSQFLSPYTNQRTDAYGGNAENRMRFPLEVLAKVREYVGPDFPVGYRISVEERLEEAGRCGGLCLEEAVAFCARLVDKGIDWLHVSAGLRETNYMVSPPSCVEKGWLSGLARAVKEGTGQRVPVIAVNRIADEDVAEAILEHGDADLVAMGRALIADPSLPNKAAAGQKTDIIRCIGCNDGCVGGSARGTGVGCALNPLTGREGMYDLSPTKAPKQVLVVGGGIAGMEAALVAARRGHCVSLYEKDAQLGGLLRIATRPPFKGDISLCTLHMEAALLRAGVEIHCNKPLSATDIIALKPDAVVLAIGSTPIMPGFCAAAPNAVTADKVLSGAVKPLGNALVIGGGLIGCETGEFLAAKGVTVTVLETQSEVAKDMESRTRRYMMLRMRDYGVRFLTSTQVTGINDAGLVGIKDAAGVESVLEPFHTIVVAIGYRSQTSLAQELKEAGIAFHSIGDCKQVGRILSATECALSVAASL